MRVDTIFILHIEDSELDAQLIRHALEEAHFQFQLQWVDNFADFKQKLLADKFDLVLADYSLPDCDGLDIARLVNEHRPFLPLLLVTGALGEEMAIETIHAGVTDYILKTNLMRLQTSIPRALTEAQLRRERIATYEALRTSEERFDLAVRGSGAGIWDWPVLSADEMWWSPRIFEMLGYRDGEIRATRPQLYKLMHSDDLAGYLEILQGHLSGTCDYDVEYRLQHKSGHYIWCRSRGKAVIADDGSPERMAGYIQDVSDRKLAEAERRKADERYRIITRAAQEAIIMVDSKGQVSFWNPAAESIFGFQESEVLGRDVHQIIAPEGVRQKAITAMQRFATTGEGRTIDVMTEVEGINKAGERIFLEMSLNAVRHDDEWQAIGVLRDISERKIAEAQRLELEEQLRQTQKMEALGTLAGGIAHDFNNILASILGYTSMVERRLEPGGREQRDLQEVLKASERAKQLVRQILSFSRKSELKNQPIYPDLVIKEVLRLLRASLPTTIQIETRLQASGEAILGDATQLHQVLMNLCTNAFHAMPAGGVLTIELQKIQLEDLHDSRLPAGPYLEMLVADTGCGIPEEIVDRVFDPYFTTKDVDTGTGLGLSVVRGIVNSFNGAIELESRPGEGTCFRLLFPCVDQQAEAAREAVVSRSCTGSERILIVDDEPALAQLWQGLLTEFGYQVAVLNSSQAAYEQIAAAPEKYDLVITDQTMPKLTGIGLAQKLSKVNPQLPLILCSGLNYSLDSAGVAGTGIRKVLLKTEMMKLLPLAIREIFDQ